jgi:methylphosphotriester-DNA--protein-cysteine methyltransferase
MSEVRYFVHQPERLLRRHVREILWVRSERPRTQVLLPETGLTLVLRQWGSASLLEEVLPAAIVSGLQQRSRTVEHAAHSSLVVVRFTEVGGPAILRDRVDLLYNRTVPLDEVLPKEEIEQVQNALADAHEMRQQAAAVEHFLAQRIYAQKYSSRGVVSPQIEAAAGMIRGNHGRDSIATIAHRSAMSLSALERQFRAAVGASPKSFSRLARLQYVCRLWDSGMSLTEIAFAAGYSDQPHLVRDFQLITGTSPEQFFLSGSPRNLPTFYK